ncbi:MAG: lysylphosphatidylglycerol synthase transmembrane domain-containing protein [Actinomycetota bacterium]
MNEPTSPPPPGSTRTKRILQAAVSLVIVVGIFVYAIPRIADYSAVWATVQDLSPIELWTLVGAMFFNLVTYWLANMAALPGLSLAQSAVLTQTTTSVANTLPAGGAVAVGLTYSILRSWGFYRQSIALYVGVTGVWNVFLKLGLPIVALALLALTGQATLALVIGALIGLAVLAVAVALFALALWRKDLARRIGDRLGRIVSAVRHVVRRPPVGDWGEQAVAFRSRTIRLVARRWLPLTLATVTSHLALWFVLLLSLRDVGISETEVSSLQVLAVFAFGRLIGALPITPGGLGVIELGYIGGLVAAGGNEPQVVAAVLLFRVLTFGIQIPLGGFTYLIWRARSGWRREATEGEPQAAEGEPEAAPAG